jgi:endonuclease VIII
VPEGDTIYLLANRLRERVLGQVVRHYDAWEPALRRMDVTGQALTAIHTRGKNLLFDFSGGDTLHSHLKMEGKWAFRDVSPLPTPTGMLNVVMGFERGALLGYRLGVLRWVRMQTLPANDPLRALGPDLLGRDVDVDAIVEQFRAHGRLPIGVALMHQGLMAGVGNEYKSELLFLERLSPFLAVEQVSDEKLRSLVRRSQRLLRENVASAALGFHRRQTRARNGGGGSVWVYGRGGQHCLVCDDRVQVVYQGQPPRSTYFCPACQPLASSGEP